MTIKSCAYQVNFSILYNQKEYWFKESKVWLRNSRYTYKKFSSHWYRKQRNHPINDFVFDLENILKLITCTARQLALVWFLLVLILDWREHGICLEEQLLKIDRSSSCLSCVIVKVKLGKLGKLWTWNRRRGLQNSC